MIYPRVPVVHKIHEIVIVTYILLTVSSRSNGPAIHLQKWPVLFASHVLSCINECKVNLSEHLLSNHSST